MKNECSYVRDILPLYLENMVSEDTCTFVKEHLEGCPACAAELEAMKAGANVERIGDEVRSDLDNEALKTMKSIRKKSHKRAYRVAAVIAGIFIAVCLLLRYFPIYRVFELWPMITRSYYTNEELRMALCVGSVSDRAKAQAVLRLADQAFNDTRHTRAENEEAYGLLARYATATDIYDASFNEHSLELWSAHLGKDEGWIWVFYSSESFYSDGSTACGSWRIPSLWKVEKKDTGEWTVVQIREHP